MLGTQPLTFAVLMNAGGVSTHLSDDPMLTCMDVAVEGNSAFAGVPTGEFQGFISSPLSGSQSITAQLPLTVSEPSTLLEHLAATAVLELLEYRDFEDGWDAYGGVAPASMAVAAALGVVGIATTLFRDAGAVPTDVVPGPASDGSVDVEISFGGRHLIFTFYEPVTEVQIFAEDEHERHEGAARFDDASVERWIRWLLGEIHLPVDVAQA